VEVVVSGGSVRERLSTLSRGELVGLAFLLVAALAGVALWYMRSLPRPVEVRASGSNVSPSAVSSVAPSPETVLLVDVAGWVRHPGVYEFHEGDRVIDAIDASGGARPGAALSSLNLAAPLVDGSQILVARSAPDGSVEPPPGVAPGTPGSTTKININTAAATELEALPGVGEVIAQAIVDFRTENGPFTTIEDLLDVSGIGDATFADMKDLITI
jgi:competence protein ComEA